MIMDQDHKRQELQDKVAKCHRLAREFPDGITNKNLRDLAAELEHHIRDLDRQTFRHETDSQ
jgi:Mn-dependent DtxR family transcriptional regulator